MKLIKRLLLLGIIVVAVVVAVGYFNKPAVMDTLNNNARYAKKVPSYQQYPRIVQTSSRAYYVATLKDDGVVMTLTNYAFYDFRKWQSSSIPLPLDRRIFGRIEIYDRPQGG